MKRIRTAALAAVIIAVTLQPAFAQRGRAHQRTFVVVEPPSIIWQILTTPLPPWLVCQWLPTMKGCESING